MTILKDAQYWKEYNQKRRAYLTLKERQRRAKLKGVYNSEHVQLPNLACTTKSNKSCTTILSTTTSHVQRVQPAISDKVVHQEKNVQPETVVDIEQVVDQKQDNLVVDRTSANFAKVVPISTTENKKQWEVLDIEAYNQEVYKRAGTKDPQRFFTFADGKKIVRTKCGCNPTKDFYDWCLDSCEYFTWWRNEQIK